MTSLPPISLVDHQMAFSQQMGLSARVFICPHHTLLPRIISHMSKSHEFNHGGIFHPLLIPTGFHRVAQKMQTFTGIETDISLVNGIILESTGGHVCRLSLVTKAFAVYFFLRLSVILCSDLLNKWYINCFSGPYHCDGSRMAHAPMPYSGPVRETDFPNNRWNYPPRSMNHRQLNPYGPPSEGPIPVANKGLSSLYLILSCNCFTY